MYLGLYLGVGISLGPEVNQHASKADRERAITIPSTDKMNQVGRPSQVKQWMMAGRMMVWWQAVDDGMVASSG